MPTEFSRQYYHISEQSHLHHSIRCPQPRTSKRHSPPPSLFTRLSSSLASLWTTYLIPLPILTNLVSILITTYTHILPLLPPTLQRVMPSVESTAPATKCVRSKSVVNALTSVPCELTL